MDRHPAPPLWSDPSGRYVDAVELARTTAPKHLPQALLGIGIVQVMVHLRVDRTSRGARELVSDSSAAPSAAATVAVKPWSRHDILWWTLALRMACVIIWQTEEAAVLGCDGVLV